MGGLDYWSHLYIGEQFSSMTASKKEVRGSHSHAPLLHSQRNQDQWLTATFLPDQILW
jgi:hypothetical protein